MQRARLWKKEKSRKAAPAPFIPVFTNLLFTGNTRNILRVLNTQKPQTMTTVTIHSIPGQPHRITAQDEAIRQGFNCYSKPARPELEDFQTDREAVFYYTWHGGQILEVIVRTTDADPLQEPEQDGTDSRESKTATVQDLAAGQAALF